MKGRCGRRLQRLFLWSTEEAGGNCCAIFIDGAYLEFVLKGEFGRPPMDFAALANRVAGARELLRTYFYDCLPYQSARPTPDERERFARREQKRVDILLGVDLVQLATKHQISDAMVVAGDSDFLPAIEVAKQEGVVVHLFHGASLHNELLTRCDERVRIDDEFVAAIRRR
jgi:hypothetical protein